MRRLNTFQKRQPCKIRIFRENLFIFRPLKFYFFHLELSLESSNSNFIKLDKFLQDNNIIIYENNCSFFTFFCSFSCMISVFALFDSAPQIKFFILPINLSFFSDFLRGVGKSSFGTKFSIQKRSLNSFSVHVPHFNRADCTRAENAGSKSTVPWPLLIIFFLFFFNICHINYMI